MTSARECGRSTGSTATTGGTSFRRRRHWSSRNFWPKSVTIPIVCSSADQKLAVLPSLYVVGMTAADPVVYGERIDDILPGLFALRDSMTIGRDGMCHFSVTLEP